MIPRTRLLTTLVITLASVCAVVGVSRIEFDDNPQNLFRSNSDEWRYMDEVCAQFGADDNTCYLLVSADELFCSESIEDLRQLTIRVRGIRGVDSELSILERRIIAVDSALRPMARPAIMSAQEVERARNRALTHPLFAGQLLNEKGNQSLVKVQLSRDTVTVGDLQPITDELWDLADQFTRESSLKVQMTGIPAIRVEAFNKVREQTATYTVLGALAGLTIAIILMRRASTVLIICAVSACAALWTTGALGLAGEKISLLTSILPMLVLMIGLTDAVHLAFDIRRSRASGATPAKATSDAMRHLTKACFLTSLTTAIGFCSLYATETDLVRRFGLACTAGCGITFVAVITVLPALTSTRLGRGVLPPVGMATVELWMTSVLNRLIDLTLQFRWQVFLAGVGLSLWFATLAIGLLPENEMSESLPQNARSIVALRTIDRDFGGIMPAMIVAEWPEHVQWQSDELYEVLNKLHHACIENSATHHPFSIVNVMNSRNDRNLSRVPQSILDSLVHPNARRAVITSRVRDQGSSSLTASFTQLAVRLDDIERQHPGYRFRLSGFAVLATRSIQTMISDLASSLGLATLAIFATMSIACRSIRIGLICLLPNAFPLLLTAAMLYVFDGTLRFSSVIVFSVCLGIAVNDTIHLVSRFQREMRKSGDVEKSLRNSMSAVGSALIVTTLILIVGLSIPISSDVSASRTFGTLSCLAIASALLADLILLPAMLACFVRGTLSNDSTAAIDLSRLPADS